MNRRLSHRQSSNSPKPRTMTPNNNEAILKQLGIRWKALAAYCEQVHINATVEDWQYFVLGMEDLISHLKAILPQSDSDEDDSDEDDSDEADSDEADSDEADSDEADSDEADSDEADSDEADSDEDDSDEDDSDEDDSDEDDSDEDDSDEDDSDEDDSDEDDSDEDDSDEDDSDEDDSDEDDSDEDDSDEDDSDEDDSDEDDSDEDDSDEDDSDENDSDEDDSDEDDSDEDDSDEDDSDENDSDVDDSDVDPTNATIATSDRLNASSTQFLTFRSFANAFPEYVRSRKPIRERYSADLKKQAIQEFASDHERIKRSLSNSVRRYSKSLCDVGEIFARVALGESIPEICLRWAPALNRNDIELLFYQIIATTPKDFRKECSIFTKYWLFDSIDHQFFDYLRIETSNHAKYSDGQRSLILNQISSVMRKELEKPPEAVGEFLQWPEPSIKAKLNEKLLEFRNRVQIIIKNSAFYGSLDDRTRVVLNQRLSGATLAEIGKRLKLTRERVRQKIKSFTGNAPIVTLFFTVREKRNYEPNDPQVSHYKQEFIKEFTRMPEGFYVHDSEGNSYLERLPEESKRNYVRRLFANYMQNTIRKPADEKRIEAIIHISRGNRRRIYAKMLDYWIQQSCKNYKFPIHENQLNYYLYKAGLQGNNLNPKNILIFLHKLVSFPKQPAHVLCGEAGLDNRIGRKIQSIFFDEVLEESRRRAREALSISSRINARVPFSEKMIAVLQSRYLKQLSIAETCREIGIQTPHFAIIDSRLRKAVPSLALITPRRSMRK